MRCQIIDCKTVEKQEDDTAPPEAEKSIPVARVQQETEENGDQKVPRPERENPVYRSSGQNNNSPAPDQLPEKKRPDPGLEDKILYYVGITSEIREEDKRRQKEQNQKKEKGRPRNLLTP